MMEEILWSQLMRSVGRGGKLHFFKKVWRLYFFKRLSAIIYTSTTRCTSFASHWSRRHKHVIADSCFGFGSVVIWRRFITLGFSQTQLFFFLPPFAILANSECRTHAFKAVACLHKVLISNAIEYSVLLLYTVVIDSLPLVITFVFRMAQ